MSVIFFIGVLMITHVILHNTSTLSGEKYDSYKSIWILCDYVIQFMTTFCFISLPSIHSPFNPYFDCLFCLFSVCLFFYLNFLPTLTLVFLTSRLDLSRVKLMRYEDPVLGPRRVPILGQEEQGKLPISSKSVFSINLNEKKVTLADNGLTVDIGDTLVYLIQ